MKVEKPGLMEAIKDYPKEIILKDGTGVTLRPLKSGDEKLLYDMFKRFPVDELWFLNHDVSDPKLLESWIKDLDISRVVSIVAMLEGKIIANAALMMKSHGSKSHIGKIRIAVDPLFREKRLGTWMLLDLINVAIAIGLQILVMRLVQGRDDSIISGVRKLGFSEEAVIRDHLLDKEGNRHNLVVMRKSLPVDWEDF